MNARRSPTALAVAGARVAAGVAVVVVLLLTYAGRVAARDANPFDFFGYFTNQTSLLTSLVLIAVGTLTLAGRPVPHWLTVARGVVTGCLIVVAVVYNTLVPGTGSAPPWVSVVLHVVVPLLVLLDWTLVGDRPALAWRRLWLVLPYPVAWLVVTLIRGRTDGWVPYGFLLPDRGPGSLAAHVVGLFAAMLGAGAVVWAASRFRGLMLRRGDGRTP
ncbi:hypothetical protein BW730_05005 [Tessaracoccus aquimaris]|uniref:F420-dependent oxidoreductase n=1 Tax=Tessaracoccus aquimaris TaxID=1332264 RepID=A0A1Q2CLI5_9ACTN|nr:Pr6Pr family membrane protein [Tessaracoccus aquimaris]AQP46973.1 hypothetical protein BW730_05005 [Tessaracoccus aquimaris]